MHRERKHISTLPGLAVECPRMTLRPSTTLSRASGPPGESPYSTARDEAARARHRQNKTQPDRQANRRGQTCNATQTQQIVKTPRTRTFVHGTGRTFTTRLEARGALTENWHLFDKGRHDTDVFVTGTFCIIYVERKETRAREWMEARLGYVPGSR